MSRRSTGRPIPREASVHMVHLLALRPDLRDVFPLAVAVDAAVREGA